MVGFNICKMPGAFYTSERESVKGKWIVSGSFYLANPKARLREISRLLFLSLERGK